MTAPFDRSREESRRARPLERGWVRHMLIRELAENAKTQEELAAEYGVTKSAVSSFKARWLTEIKQVAKDLDAEMSALWIVSKANRLAELESDVDKMSDALDDELDVDLIKAKHVALMQAAKELGQIPSSAGVHVQTQAATFRIDGVDLSTLT